jgi:hypothetical protein
MRVTVIDGQGGRLGRQLVEAIRERYPGHEITAVGTNTIATAAMIRGGAHHAATGENAVIVACRTAEAIIGPIGIVIADALYGEITPAMAAAVGQSRAGRILIPMTKCDNLVAGVADLSLQALVADAVEKIGALCV